MKCSTSNILIWPSKKEQLLQNIPNQFLKYNKDFSVRSGNKQFGYFLNFDLIIVTFTDTEIKDNILIKTFRKILIIPNVGVLKII